jgi:hypothetical protein
MKRSNEYLIWMKTPLVANGAEAFRIIGDMKIARFARKQKVLL